MATKKQDYIQLIVLLALIFLLAILMAKSGGDVTALFTGPRP